MIDMKKFKQKKGRGKLILKLSFSIFVWENYENILFCSFKLRYDHFATLTIPTAFTDIAKDEHEVLPCVLSALRLLDIFGIS